ncbi:transglutaminase domain-containing protein [Streptomyces sp. NPDC091289]|uniref:transglutaminase domain-containing protein n=1 Tax=Streptomyces sp. NPDC091289 TaxID=3365989 RepID=UPI003803552C
MTIPDEGLPPERIIASLLRIPNSHRVFSLPIEALEKTHGITIEIARELIDAGIPFHAAADGPLLDENDVASASLYLRLPSARRSMMTFWLRALHRLRTAHAPSAHRVEVTAACPDPGHDGPCAYGVALDDGPRSVCRADRPESVRLGTLRTPPGGRPRELPTVVRDLLRDFHHVDYYRLPRETTRDSGFLRRTGMADCTLMARALVDEGLRHGLNARFAAGLIIAVPFSTAHTWAEFEVDGAWLPADPLLPRALSAWGVPKAGDWPVTLAPNGLFHRLAGAPRDMVTHAGRACGVSLRTREEPS